MTGPNFREERDNWSELVARIRREEQLSPDQIQNDDPCGVIELAETLQHAHEREGLRLCDNFPFFDSFYALEFSVEAYRQCDYLISQGQAWAEANLVRGTDYELFDCAAGEVTAFHFRTEEMRRKFREALGVDPVKGYGKN